MDSLGSESFSGTLMDIDWWEDSEDEPAKKVAKRVNNVADYLTECGSSPAAAITNASSQTAAVASPSVPSETAAPAIPSASSQTAAVAVPSFPSETAAAAIPSASSATRPVDSNLGDSWRRYQVWLHRDFGWWQRPSGIIDLQALERPRLNASEGMLLELAFRLVKTIVLAHDCYFKIGMCSDLESRWLLYQDRDSKWRPSHLCILMPVKGRSAAGWAEAALICMCRELHIDSHLNVNLKHKDRGGTGSRLFEDAIRYLYLAVLPKFKD